MSVVAADSLRYEAGRKAVHLATIVLPAWMYWVPPPWSWRGPLLAFLVVLGIDVLRLRWQPLHRRLEARIGSYLRPAERRQLISVHYLTCAAVLLAWSVPQAVGAAALGYLVVGDAAAALVGRRFGRHRFGSKSLEGSLACLVSCLALGALLLPDRPQAVLGGALVATVSEALPLPLDDNLSVPLLSAAALLALV
jgi:dolichol kinase